MRRTVIKRIATAAAVVAVLLLAGCTRMPFDTTSVTRAPQCEPWRGLSCRVASGRIIYVQRHDPDGDGDVHIVLASRGSLTWPGISVVKLPATLRDTPNIGVGRWLVASGETFDGSHGEPIMTISDVATYSRW